MRKGRHRKSKVKNLEQSRNSGDMQKTCGIVQKLEGSQALRSSGNAETVTAGWHTHVQAFVVCPTAGSRKWKTGRGKSKEDQRRTFLGAGWMDLCMHVW